MSRLYVKLLDLLFEYGLWTAGLPSVHNMFEGSIPTERETNKIGCNHADDI